MNNYYLILSIGFLAQLFFSARILVQWALSEKAKKVLSPSLFWILSLAGSYLLCLYGWLKNDFAIILGQFISYYIYIWNLYAKGIWPKLHILIKAILIITPIIALFLLLKDATSFMNDFFKNKEIPLSLLIFGSLGQVIFTLRFVYQWVYSYKKNKSILPAGFWVISLVGSLIIVTYGFIRKDLVLIIGQSFGVLAYSRNLYLWNHQKIAINEK